MPQKILIVDDKDATRQEVVEYLGHKGYDCVDASGAGSAPGSRWRPTGHITMRRPNRGRATAGRPSASLRNSHP